TLITIAKDVKVQVAFDPARVAEYRLIGYEDRLMRREDFDNDRVDAGEIGAGHTVTALYEVAPVADAPAGDLLTLRLRWKEPTGDVSSAMELPVRDGGASFENASPDLRFAAAVAEFGMLLRASPHKGTATFASARSLASASLGPDPHGWRHEFVSLIDRAASL